MQKWSTVGRITRVDTKYAFISAEGGDGQQATIFSPLAAAVPQDEQVPDLKMRYNAGDVVHVRAVPQNGKNGCQWRAVKVRPIAAVPLSPSHSREDQRVLSPSRTPTTSRDADDRNNGSTVINKVVIVMHAQETLCYARSDELGTVFVPGLCFQKEETTRLNSYLSSGDFLMISARSQTAINGCSWVATSATKILNPPREEVQSHEVHVIGRVLEVGAEEAIVWNDKYTTIRCTKLAWSGGCKRSNATGLNDVVSTGAEVRVILRSVGGSPAFASSWCCTNDSSVIRAASLCDSSAQTSTSAAEFLVRMLRNNGYLDMLLADKPMLAKMLKQDM